jgi:hypothetical protein
MGLSVSVYKNIKPCEKENANFVAYVSHASWEWKIKNLDYGQGYKGRSIHGVGVAYAYSYHGLFRGFLLGLAGRNDLILKDGKVDYDKIYGEKITNIPFFDFIDFADNGGCLDWDVSEKILKDFELHAEKANQSNKATMQEFYTQWHDIFKAAVEHKGVVEFS